MITKGFGLANANFKPCPYQNLPSVGGLEKVYGLTKHEIVIQINVKKPTYYPTMCHWHVDNQVYDILKSK